MLSCSGTTLSPNDLSISSKDASQSSVADSTTGRTDPSRAGLSWPNAQSQANSEPWLMQHHDEITVMRPKVMLLNFVNEKSQADATALTKKIIAGFAEGTRYHGYEDQAATSFLQFELAYAIDLRDKTPPPNWTLKNSSLYPREDPPQGYWSLDYGKLFSSEFARLYNIDDPQQGGKKLTLCELFDRGMVHEVWIYGYPDNNDKNAKGAEILGRTPYYDVNGKRLNAKGYNACAGNGCFDEDDVFPSSCSRTIRVAWIDATRGPGCLLHSYGHGIEGIGRAETTPYFTQYWNELAGFNLRQRYSLPIDHWYECFYGDNKCLTYPNDHSVTWALRTEEGQITNSGTIDPYVPVCGNTHFPTNARGHYDDANQTPIQSTCQHYRQGGGLDGTDKITQVSAKNWQRYDALAPDCSGAWMIWWWQNIPGFQNKSKDAAGKPMKNWWPYLYY